MVPFNIGTVIGTESFSEMSILVDGIYPPYSQFAKGIMYPTNSQETCYTKWQEAARKDIERAFGLLLQGHQQFIVKPIHLFEVDTIAARAKICLILHNMGVSDRVMDWNVRACYNPCHNLNTTGIIGSQGTWNKSRSLKLSLAEKPLMENGNKIELSEC